MKKLLFFAAIILTASGSGCKKSGPIDGEYLPPPIVQSMILVPGGTFQMSRPVTVGTFSIDKYEITYETWTDVRAWALKHGYAETDIAIGQSGATETGAPADYANNPVTQVKRSDVLKWCNARSEKDSLTPMYYTDNTFTTVYRAGEMEIALNAVKWSAHGYRLPTEAEWEFAARGGNLSHGYLYSGSDSVGLVAWYGANSGATTHSVGLKLANELGIHDMSGNVWEMCWDWWGALTGPMDVDPLGPSSGSSRVYRGGSFRFPYLNYCYVSYRATYSSAIQTEGGGGFRCVRK